MKTSKIFWIVAFVIAFLIVVNTSLTAYACGSDELSEESDEYGMEYNYEDASAYNSDVFSSSMYSIENEDDNIVEPNGVIETLALVIGTIIAEHGASFEAGVIIGAFCKNNGIDYWVGQGALFVATSPLPPTGE